MSCVCLSLASSGQHVIKWVDLVGVTENAGVLTKTESVNAWSAGATSSNRIAPGVNGWLQFTITAHRGITIGFVMGKYHMLAHHNFSHAINIGTGNAITVHDGNATFSYGNVRSGDVFRIERNGTQLKYFKNGAMLRSVSVDAALELNVRALIYTGKASTPVVVSSSPPELLIRPLIMATGADRSNGSISVDVVGGTPPYTYSWSTGESSGSISGKSQGNFTLEINDDSGLTAKADYAIGYKTYWIDLNGVVETSGILNKTNMTVGWNSGAVSSNILPSGTDGWIEFTIDNPGSQFEIGFALTGSGSYGHNVAFRHGIMINNTTGLFSTHDGSSSTSYQSWRKGDVFRLAREGSSVAYYGNGIKFRIAAADPLLELKLKAAVYYGKCPTVQTSFDGRVVVDPSVKHIGQFSESGAIALPAKGGTLPYTYHWNTEETSDKIENKQAGDYSVEILDAEGRRLTASYSIGNRVTWTRVQGVSTIGGEVKKTASKGWNAGAIASTELAGGAPGWIEWVVANNLHTYIVGFAGNSTSYNSTSFSNGLLIDAATGKVSRYEGSASSFLCSFHPGDIFRLERANDQINYFRNGLLIQSSPASMVTTLYCKVSLNTVEATIPELTTSFEVNELKLKTDAWAFQYRYDERKRMVGRKVPGSDWVWMVYDKRDRLVLSQDGNQRPLKQWSFTKYDGLDRAVMTGIMDTSVALSQSQMQAVVDAFYKKPSARLYLSKGGPVHGYTNESYPLISDLHKYLTVTWYDDYSFKKHIRDSGRLSFKMEEGGSAAAMSPLGMPTGTKLKVLDGGTWGGTSWLVSAKYYDKKQRLIQTVEDNLKGGTDRTTIENDFTGKVMLAKTTHQEWDPTWIERKDLNIAGNKLSKSTTIGGWTSGTASQQVLAGGESGWLETEFTPGAGNVAIGLNARNDLPTLNDIDYAIYFNGSTLRIYENGVSRLNAGQLVGGDIVRIERDGSGIVNYKKNGTVIYTSSVQSMTPLVADIAIGSTGSFVQNVRTSFSHTVRSVENRMTYDHAGRLLYTSSKLDDDGDIMIARKSFNELGQLTEKKLHSEDGVNFHQSNSYRYNIRGWLRSVNGEESMNQQGETPTLFGFDLLYNESDPGINNDPQFGGNISGMSWSTNLGLGIVKRHGYAFRYDSLNRILSADFKNKSDVWADLPSFDESGYSYDANGNILGLKRYGTTGVIDDLAYDYRAGSPGSNRLMTVKDNADIYHGFKDASTSKPDYSYDNNGNMLTDQNKGIAVDIKYNFLNLPEKVTRGSGNTIHYIYDAAGRKLSQSTTFSTTQKQIDYVGAFEYDNDVLQRIETSEGRIVLAGREVIYHNDGDFLEGMTYDNAQVSIDTLNGEQTYIKVNTISSGTRPELIMASFDTKPGEQYLIRLKGYKSGTTSTAHIVTRINGINTDWPGASLANSLTAESWIEQNLTVSDSGQVMSIGVAWKNDVPAGSVMYINDIEVVRITSVAPEYQYYLKDHLGNVRLTFTTATEKDSQTATVEPHNDAVEKSQFLRFDNMRRVSSYLFDHTNGMAPSMSSGYAQRLNGSPEERVGLAKSLWVLPGDTVRMQVFSKYVDPEEENWSGALTMLMGYVLAPGTAPTGTLIDGASYASDELIPAWALTNFQSSEDDLNAGLAYIMFNKDMEPIFDPEQTNIVRLSRSVREQGQDVNHEKLYAEVLVKQPGFMYIYLSNNEDHQIDVYFDDFSVEHAKGPVVQSDEYYPFGERFNSFIRENEALQRSLYNGGTELQTELGLNVYETQHRTYDPVLGRWWQVDPKPDQGGQESWSIYQYAFDSPTYLNDPNGDCPPLPCLSLSSAAAADAAVRPNGIGAHAMGIAQGLQDSAVGLYHAVTNPGQTLQGLGNLALAGLAQNPATAIQMDAVLGTNASGAMTGLQNAISTGASNLISGNGQQRGEVIGEIAGALVGSKGLGYLNSAFTSAVSIRQMSTLFHSTSTAGGASSILSTGINSSFFSSASRFGKGFYLSNSPSTTVAELAHHGSATASTLQFTLAAGGRFLNATSPAMSLGVTYGPKLLTATARGLGYDGIMYNSLRASGTNLVMFKNFNLLQNGKVAP
jgi:RHS repeat-associated protein